MSWNWTLYLHLLNLLTLNITLVWMNFRTNKENSQLWSYFVNKKMLSELSRKFFYVIWIYINIQNIYTNIRTYLRRKWRTEYDRRRVLKLKLLKNREIIIFYKYGSCPPLDRYKSSSFIHKFKQTKISKNVSLNSL